MKLKFLYPKVYHRSTKDNSRVTRSGDEYFRGLKLSLLSLPDICCEIETLNNHALMPLLIIAESSKPKIAMHRLKKISSKICNSHIPGKLNRLNFRTLDQ